MYAKLYGFIAERVALGDRLGEAFYAVWMVVVSIGLLNSVAHITREHVMWVVMVALSVNVTWGIIDGVTAMLTGIIARARHERLIHDLRKGDVAARKSAEEQVEELAGGDLPAEERTRIVSMLAAGPASPHALRRFGPSRDDWLYAFSFFLIDVALAIPILFPLLIFNDLAVGIFVSRLVAVAFFAFLGARYAVHLNREPWPGAVALGLLGLVVATTAYETGW
jgi:VIT1/CCC1 family predicted Fe2+/Mn2+ transporter